MMAAAEFHGIFTPLVTPVDRDQCLDLESLGRLVEYQIQQRVHGLWVMGTTGEFASFEEDERAAAVAAVVSQADGRIPIVANVSDAATRLATRHARRAEEAGADALALTPPYYYSHSQSELLLHYRTVARATLLPLFIYNIPQTVRVAVTLDTAVLLAEEGTVAGIKDSQNNLEWFRELTLKLGSVRPEFRAFAGTRHLIDAGMVAGAAGAIPSIANTHPDLCVDTYEAAVAGDYRRANASQSRIVQLESEIQSAKGSLNGATIGRLKRILHERGVIACSKLTEPLLVD